MSFDKTVPAELKSTQQWFASIITRPIDENSQMNPISPSGVPMTEEAKKYIVPSPTLKPAQRIQIYNQQYWWRLITTMQETFPTLLRLFGYHDFNQTIAVPYLAKYPPNHWSLNQLGNRLTTWIEESYLENDKLVYDIAKIDWAFNDSFLAASKNTLDMNISEETLQIPLSLQPHLTFFEMPYDLFTFRKEFLKQEPDYWVDNEFPELKHLPEIAYFAFYRDANNNMNYQKLEKSEYQILKQFEKPTSIEAVCEWLEEQDESFCDEASQHLQQWFQKWAMMKWLGK